MAFDLLDDRRVAIVIEEPARHRFILRTAMPGFNPIRPVHVRRALELLAEAQAGCGNGRGDIHQLRRVVVSRDRGQQQAADRMRNHDQRTAYGCTAQLRIDGGGAALGAGGCILIRHVWREHPVP